MAAHRWHQQHSIANRVPTFGAADDRLTPRLFEPWQQPMVCLTPRCFAQVPPSEPGSGGGYIRNQWKLLLGKQRGGNSFGGPLYPNASTPEDADVAVASNDLDCGASGCLWDIFADENEEHDGVQLQHCTSQSS